MKTTDQTADVIVTPYIAVAANYFGTGKTAQEARKNLAKAGGSPQEPQTVFKLPDGAVGAFVADSGDVHWTGVEGEMRPVFRYVNGKAVAWGQGEDKPVPFKKPTAKTKPKQAPQAQTDGADVEVPETSDKESTIASTDLPKAAAKPARKPAKVAPEPETVGESNQEPADAVVAAPAKPKKPAKKPAPAVEPATEPEITTEVRPSIDETGADGRTVTPPKPAKVTAAKKPATPVAADGGEAADFLLFIGGSMYTKGVFIKEAAEMGISRRMPSHRLPTGLVCGKSKVYLAADGLRKTDGEPSSEVFGYFVPSAVHFIAGANSKEFADVIGSLKLRKDAKIITSTKGEPERACGHRQEGGTYIVVDKADSPFHALAKPAAYVGNHFRGMLRLNDLQARQFNTGGTVATLIDEKCMKCGDAMKCAPDGHARAERERKRIEKGEQPKWLLLDAKCQKEVRAQRAADDGPQSADDSNQGDPSQEGAATE